jgi:hypothetical protein
LVANHLDTKRIKAVQHQNIVFHALLKQIPWGVVDRLVEEWRRARIRWGVWSVRFG